MKYFNCISVFSLRAGDVSVLFERGHNHPQNMLQLVNNEQSLFVHLSLTKGCLFFIMLFIQKISPFLIGSSAPSEFFNQLALTEFVRRMRYLGNASIGTA